MNDIGLGEAYTKWAEDLVGYATSIVGPDAAPDVVADAFAVLLASDLVGWQAAREPRAYLFRCVLNAARMHARSQARRSDREERAGRRQPTPSDGLLADPAVAEAVRSLTVGQRAALYHTYWDDLSTTAVAERMGVSEGTVKRQLARARARLRKVLR